MGFVLGFATMNFQATLTDLFGASLMSGNPHQEVVDKFDVRRHGGGMGVWIGIWTFCFTGSIGIGFLIGASVINSLNPSWGFYICIVIIAVVLVLNVLCPEVRRSAYRRSVAEVRRGSDVSRRVARGEIMMHRVKGGPKWWGQEVYHGVMLSLEMLRQPGFAVMAVYTGWIYAQVVLIIVLLGSLTSKYYMLRSPLVGTCVFFVSFGALIAVPFQKANIFSRGRHHANLSSAVLTEKKVTWTSHFLRRATFCIGLPLAGIAYTLSSYGPPVPVEVPTLFAAIVGIMSGLALSECTGLIMEIWDTSDLQPGMTGRPRSNSKTPKRTNYSSFPRVTAGFACCQTFSFIFAAGATALGGMAERNLGQRQATGVVAAILFLLTLFLLAVFIRFKHVQIIPNSKEPEMDKWQQVRRQSIIQRRRSIADPKAKPGPLIDDELWRPIIIGNPSDKKRRVNVLEMGGLTRWTEIRKRNKLIDKGAVAHPNRAALESARDAVVGQAGELGAMATGLVRKVSERSQNQRYHSASPKPTDKFAQRAPSAGLPDHRHTPGAGGECIMDQTVQEEDEAGSEREIDADEEDVFVNANDKLDRAHDSHPTTSKAGNAMQD
ncbi:hypothetical protein DL546_007423 [Coniochaeta pulveracea]|uniref:Polyamine transport protein n=1 Tax=Coniochaeta pulveracea TaxID=177199 RepID=A0A420Y965_9PEZI|nr:hypothetical protein DL546_007423 [Coniochaeta pulveracea]